MLAGLHKRVFSGYAGASAGERYLRSVFEWFVARPDAINLCVGAVGDPYGYAFGAPFGSSVQLNRDLFGELTLAILTHPWLLTRPGLGIQVRNRLRALVLGREDRRAEGEFGAGTFNLVGIGTDPDRRRQGAGTRLLSQFSALAFAKGFVQLTLDVYARNEAAKRLYWKQGWECLIDRGEVLTLVLRRIG